MADASQKKTATNSTKMRKSRNDIVRSALGVYLKQRNYVPGERFRKSDLALTQSKKQFMFNKMITEDVSRVNSFTNSNVLCLSNNHTAVEQQFAKFVQFVEMQPDGRREELSNLFGPLIGHFYIELLKGREWTPAVEFLRNNAHLVAPVENLNAPLPNKVNGCSVISTPDSHSTTFPAATTQILFQSDITLTPIMEHFKNLLQTLSSTLQIESIEANEAITLFRSSKYQLEISSASLNALKYFLSTDGHVLILNLLDTWIRFDVIDLKDDNVEKSEFILEEPQESSVGDNEIKAHLNTVLENGIDTFKHLKSDKKEQTKDRIKKDAIDNEKLTSPVKAPKKEINCFLKGLMNSAESLQKLNTQVRTFKILECDKRLSTATIDQSQCHLAAGFDNSEIRLWQLNRNLFRGRSIYQRISDKSCDWEANCESCNETSSSDEDDGPRKRSSRRPDKRKIREKFMNAKYEGNSFDDTGGISLRGHGKGVTDALFSKHSVLLTTSKDCTMRAWKASDYSCGAIYRGHNYPIWCVGENPLGMYLATGSRDATARLWSLERQFPLITYVGHTQDVDCIAFHPNGNYLATGSTDLSVRLWCATSGKLFRVFTECRLPVATIAFSPDGKYLAAGGEESKVRIFDLAAGSQFSELKEHSAAVTGITWNSCGTKFVSGCTDGSVRVWDATKIGVGDQNQQPSTSHSATSSSNSAGSSSAAGHNNESGNNTSSSSNSNNRVLWQMQGGERSFRVFFNLHTDTVTSIGT